MPKRRDVNLDEYNIGRYEYRELHNFCMQYDRKKKQLLSLRCPCGGEATRQAPEADGHSAVIAQQLAQDIDAINQCAVEAGGDEYNYLLMAVTSEGVPWFRLRTMGMRMGEHTFYKCKRKFYFLLARRKNML